MMYAAVAVVVLILIFLIVRNVNLPKIIEQRRLAAKERDKRQDEDRAEREAARKKREEERAKARAEREPLFPWRRKPKVKPPEVKP